MAVILLWSGMASARDDANDPLLLNGLLLDQQERSHPNNNFAYPYQYYNPLNDYRAPNVLYGRNKAININGRQYICNVGDRVINCGN